MKTQTAQPTFAKHVQDSLGWLLPVSLTVFTFLILFFSISEQVSGIKSVNSFLVAETTRLQDKISYLESANTFADVPTTGSKAATIINDNELIKKTVVDYQNIPVASKVFWTYALQGKFAEVKPNTSETYLLESGDLRAKVVSYTLNDTTKSPAIFDLHEYNSANKTLVVDGKNYSSFVLFVNGKVVIYNDFANNNKSTLKSVLSALAESNTAPGQIKQSASEELKRL